MEGATLTFRFVEEGGGARGPSPNPQAVEGQVDQSVSATQAAITNAGGVGAFVNRNNPQPVPPSTSFQVPTTAPLPVPAATTTTASSNDPLYNLVEAILREDPARTTAQEIANFLGVNTSQVQGYMNQIQGQSVSTPAPQLVTPPSAVPTTPSSSPTQPPPVPQIQPPPPPPPVTALTPPPVVQPPPIGVPAPPVVNPPTPPNTLPPNAAQGVINTVNSIAHLAQAGGPLGSAAAGLATATANLPGIAGGLATAAPALVAAAPYVGLATAALAVPAAGAAALNEVFANARSQLQGLDPRVASAEAEANVRQILANFRTSQRLGDEVAEGIEIRSRRRAILQEARDLFSEPLLQRKNELEEAVGAYARVLKGAATAGGNITNLGSGEGTIGGGFWKTFINSLTAPIGGINPAENVKNNNPLTYWQNKPLPKLPAPFTEAGEAVRPKVNPASFGPGLGISF